MSDPREIVTAGLIAAARERVFRAVAEPQRHARRWVPEGFHQTSGTQPIDPH
jgi:uncharacterized protein YndB with AHSA1/START domain